MSEYRPVHLTGPNTDYLSEPMPLPFEAAWPVPWQSQFDGEYYQPGNDEEVTRRKAVVLDALQTHEGLRELRLDEYQKWVEVDWKKVHGTYEALEKFRNGFFGEQVELREEIEELILKGQWKSADIVRGEDSHAAVSELGDVLWFVVAQASNSGVGIEESYKKFLHDKWESVGHTEPISIDDVDTKMTSGFIPYDNDRAAVGDDFLDDIDEDSPDLINDLLRTGAILNYAAERLYNYDEGKVDPDEVDMIMHFTYAGVVTMLAEHVFGRDDLYVTDDYVDMVRHRTLEPAVGTAIAYIAWHANHRLNSSLAEVIRVNIDKLTLRSQRGTIENKEARQQDEL